MGFPLKSQFLSQLFGNWNCIETIYMCLLNQVEENATAVTELEGLGMDQETLSEVEAILEPVKNLTWPSGIHQN